MSKNYTLLGFYFILIFISFLIPIYIISLEINMPVNEIKIPLNNITEKNEYIFQEKCTHNNFCVLSIPSKDFLISIEQNRDNIEANSKLYKFGSKTIIYDGFIDLLFNENDSVEVHAAIKDSLEHTKIIPKKRPRYESIKETVNSEDRVNQINLPSTPKNQLDKKDHFDPRIKSILSNYDILNQNNLLHIVVPGVELFRKNSETISHSAFEILKPAADAARLDENLSLTIIGHTDSIRGKDASRELSLRRAKLVKDFLSKSFGIDTRRMKVFGEGKNSPISSNSTLDGRQKNRRIEIIFSSYDE